MDNVEDIYPLTPAQLGILAHSVKAPESSAYHVQISCNLKDSRDTYIDTLQNRWSTLTRQEATLRTSVVWDELDDPVQVVQSDVALPWQTHDWRSHSEQEQERLWLELKRRDLATKFILESGALFRLYCCRTKEQEYRFLWSYHHIILDGWSSLVLWRRIFDNQAPSASQTQFRDYVAWQRSQDTQESDAYWQALLATFTEPNRIAWRENKTVQLARQRLDHHFSIEESAQIAGFLKTQRLTLNSLVTGGWALSLAFLSQSDDVVFGATLSGRPSALPEVSQAVGLFLNTLPIRALLKPNAQVLPWLQSLQTQQMDTQEYVYASLSDVQRQSGVPLDTPLFNSIVVSHGFAGSIGAEGLETPLYQDHSEYPLAILYDQAGGGVTISILAAADYAGLADGILQTIRRAVLGLVSAGKTTRLIDIELTPGQLLDPVANQSDRVQAATADMLLVDEIVAHCDNCSEKTALIAGDQTLSYAGLGQRSDRLASVLQELGTKAGDRVGLWLRTDHQVVVSMLAIWKCGATIVPVHTETPVVRVCALLGAASCGVMITDTQDMELSVATVHPDQQGHQPLVPVEVSGEDTAYIIFTSGSTGFPKGVLVSHSNLTYSTRARLDYYPKDPETFLVLSPPAFDSAMAGLFWTLSRRASLVLASEEDRRDPDRIIELVREHNVSHLLCVPSLYGAILEFAKGEDLASLQSVIVAGEACPAELVGVHVVQSPQTELYNEYGPTEATVWSTAACLYHPSQATIPEPKPVSVGRAIPGSQVAVLDHWQRSLPNYFAGEVWVSGPGVAQGYLGDGLFSEPLVNPQLQGLEGCCYQTGDYAYTDAQGHLYLLGRKDRQLKIGGHRIEPEEIERALSAHPMVDEAAVFTIATAPLDVERLTDLVHSSANGLSTLEILEQEASGATQANAYHRAGDGYRLELTLGQDQITPPRASQRDWLLRQMLDEFEADLLHLDTLAKQFVPGQESRLRNNYPSIETAKLSAQEVMEDWQEPLMLAMAEMVVNQGDDVLEIGFGRGFAAGAIQGRDPKTHTMVESNPRMIETYYPAFAEQHSDRQLEIREGRWQTELETLGLFDSILFHAFPLNEEEFVEHVLSSVTYAEHAMPALALHLRPGGAFTYLTTETDSLSRRHQRLLLEHFDEIEMKVLPTRVPRDTSDAWWSPSMVVLVARRGR